ncbi:phosphatase PAP2 family protein [Streptomyces sp. NBC_00887]|uniref:phosphatase PAP2 family protein n=1 Tax=Streptomyces sp. NBC_00887 TaxID=2975859 RepID=UPI003866E64F|nr:phosphatase PAP2 family protein [Streptomyces sp. NBC_00887]WSY35697.1 phosphatase PAP2 family protein [Streptomyces sp. NBC_00887]
MHSPSRPPHTEAGFPTTGVICAALAAVLLILVAVRWSPLMSLDRTVAEALHRRAVTESGLVQVNRVLTDWVWDPWTMRALIAVAVIALWWRGARLLAVWVAATSALATASQQGLKAALGRERPRWPDPVDSANYAAFPSGHAMTAVVSCGLLLWLLRLYGAGPRLWRTALTVAGVSVVGVAVTRLYLGVHWMTDVVGGLLLGAAVVAFSTAGYTALRRRGGRDAALSRRP